VTAEALARLFHETYERLAPEFGYETRKASAVPWEEVGIDWMRGEELAQAIPPPTPSPAEVLG
jgi:hypothetical protein